MAKITMMKNEKEKYVPKDMDKFHELFENGQKGARVRTISQEEVIEEVNYLYWFLNQDRGIKKKDLRGIVAYANPKAEKFPNAYKGVPMSTHIKVEFQADGTPIITSIFRNPANLKKYSISLTEDAKYDIIEQVEKGR